MSLSIELPVEPLVNDCFRDGEGVQEEGSVCGIFEMVSHLRGYFTSHPRLIFLCISPASGMYTLSIYSVYVLFIELIPEYLCF